MHDKTSRHPIPAAIAVVIREGQVLLVRRANPPNQNRWGFPGGKIEMGEATQTAAIRELKEETGVTAEALRFLETVDVFITDDQGQTQQHYVLIAVLCRWLHGEALAADDAAEARWFPIDDLEKHPNLIANVARIARNAQSI